MSVPSVTGPVPGRQPTHFGVFNFAKIGYEEEEYFISGTATSYVHRNAPGYDGKWDVMPALSADYTTRMVVHRPIDPAKFNGTVVVEWINVSMGMDFPAEWRYLHREIFRTGAIYVGVSAQRAGIFGGGLSPGLHLTLNRPKRYAHMVHPGDAFAYDIFSQAGRAIWGGESFLGSDPKQVIAVGESQSAFFLTTYVNAIDPVAQVYDGFLLHGRMGGSAPLDGIVPTAATPLDFDVEAFCEYVSRNPVIIREDVRVPVVIFQSESDIVLLRGIRARQPDSERIRTWEVAGAAHLDSYLLLSALIDNGRMPAPLIALLTKALSAPPLGIPFPVPGLPFSPQVNAGLQQNYCLHAALRHLCAWAAGGEPPPTAPRMITDPAGNLVLDGDGIVLGGLRTPFVDVPTMVHRGVGQPGKGFVILYGTSRFLPWAKLIERYGTGSIYRERFHQSLRKAINAGYILGADEGEIVAIGAAKWPSWPVI